MKIYTQRKKESKNKKSYKNKHFFKKMCISKIRKRFQKTYIDTKKTKKTKKTRTKEKNKNMEKMYVDEN